MPKPVVRVQLLRAPTLVADAHPRRPAPLQQTSNPTMAAFFAEAEALCNKYKLQFETTGTTIGLTTASTKVMTALSKRELRKIKKAKKDPSKPKRAATPYIAFVTQQRPQVQRDNPQMKPTDMMKELGRRWKNFSDSDKAPYVSLASKDKARWEEETAAWQAGGAGADDDAPKKVKKVTTDARPRHLRPRSFCVRAHAANALFLCRLPPPPQRAQIAAPG